jgi:hypothetical protein
LDSDDLLAPVKIARQMEVLKQCRNKSTLVSSAWGRFFYRYYRAEFAPTALWCDLSIVKEMGEMAGGLGGQLRPPHLSWKYSWTKAIVGWRLAKSGQALLLKCRWSPERFWDQTLFRLQNLRPLSKASVTPAETRALDASEVLDQPLEKGSERI